MSPVVARPNAAPTTARPSVWRSRRPLAQTKRTAAIDATTRPNATLVPWSASKPIVPSTPTSITATKPPTTMARAPTTASVANHWVRTRNDNPDWAAIPCIQASKARTVSKRKREIMGGSARASTVSAANTGVRNSPRAPITCRTFATAARPCPRARIPTTTSTAAPRATTTDVDALAWSTEA